jgi:hypothetical protein
MREVEKEFIEEGVGASEMVRVFTLSVPLPISENSGDPLLAALKEE